MSQIFVQYGDILLNGGADLTVLPCSSKHTVHPLTQGKIDKFRLAAPQNFRYKLGHGDVSRVYNFRGSRQLTKYYLYAASVLNKTSSPEVIYRIAKQIAVLTVEMDDLRVVEVPMLGAGAGRLSDEDSCVPMAKGFRETAHPDARLFIYVNSHQRAEKIEKMVNTSRLDSVFSRIRLKPGFLGVALDLDKDKERLLKRLKRK